jgi:signal peptidase I
MTSEGETATSPEPGDGPPDDPPPPGATDPVGAGSAGAGAAESASASDAGAATGAAPAGPRARRRSFWRELPVLIIIALAIALVIKTFVVQAFFIPSGSMQNTLEIGDKVLVNKLDYHLRPIHSGDIIVFDGAGSWNAAPVSVPAGDPVVRLYDATLRPLLHSIGGLFGTAPGQTDYIKRVIGVPGDHMACCNSQGLVTVNGVALHEQSYLFPGNTPGIAPFGESGHFSVTVPPGRLWVLGDHRAISDDSRGHVVDPGDGTIPENQVIGRAFVLVWPPSRWAVLRIPPTFQQPGIVPASASASAAGHAAAAASALPAVGGVLAPAAPYLPLGAGLAGGLPVTFLRRRWLLRRPRRP